MSIYHKCHHDFRQCLHGLFAAAAAIFITTQFANAQRFEEAIGGAAPDVVSGNAIINTADGDLVTAGTSTQGGAQRAYVVRTDPDGIIRWQYYYTFWGATTTSIADIKEYPNGDFIVVGDFGGQALAMRLNSSGVPIWRQWIGTANGYTTATSVVIAQHGTGTAQPGDIILSGWSGNHGLLARLDANGNRVWFKTYAIPVGGVRGAGALLGVDESRITSPQGTLGDIVATGYAEVLPNGDNYHVWVLRVNGNTGLIGAQPYGSALFGSTGFEVGYSIQELRSGGHRGDLALTGYSTGRPGHPNACTFVMQLRPAPCDPNNPRASRYADNPFSSTTNWGTCIREITSFGNVGNVVVTGNIDLGAQGSGDVFLWEFQEGTMNGVPLFRYFGGSGYDGSQSVTEVLNAPNTRGYALAGYTDSPEFRPGTGRSLYVAKVDEWKTYSCTNYVSYSLSEANTGWTLVCTAVDAIDQTSVNVAIGTNNTATWSRAHTCYTPTKPVVPGAGRTPEGNATAANVLALTSYPNPLPRGEQLTLGYTLTSPGTVHLVVTDLLGNVMQESRSQSREGRATETVPTSGWPAGTYFVRVTTGDRSATTRVVLVDH